MANYGAVIEVSVKGQEALQKLEGSARQIYSLIEGIKQQKNIFDQAVGSTQTRQLKRNLENLVATFAGAKTEARQFKITIDGSERTVNMYSRTLAGLNHQMGAFRNIANNATVGTDQYRNAVVAANKVTNELSRTQARAFKVNTDVSNMNVRDVLDLGQSIPKTLEGLDFYRSKLEEVLKTVKIGSNEFRVLEEAISGVDIAVNTAKLSGQKSAITAAAGPATRLDTVAAYEKRANYAKQIADLEYKQLTTGQQLIRAKLTESQQEELQNRLAQASDALARGELDIAKRITVELRNQRIQYERTNRAQEALMRPTTMVAGAAESITGKRPGGLAPVPGSPAAIAVAAAAAATQTAANKIKTPSSTASASSANSQLATQKRLNNLLTSAQILEQKTLQYKTKGIDLTSQTATLQNVITSIQQNGTTATKQYLDALDGVLNSLRNELKLQKEILTTQTAQNKETQKSKASTKKGADNGKLKEAVGNAIIGGAFPLLFGQGIGAAAGGGLGGFAGGMVGGNFGFGLSLVGTAVGSQLDGITQRAIDLGQALLKPTENIDKLIDALGIANTSLSGSISILRKFGYESTAASVAVEELESKLGVKTVSSVKMLGAQFTEFQNALATLSLRLTAFVSGPLASFISVLTSVVGSISNAEAARQVGIGLTGDKRKAFEADLSRMTSGAGFSGNISDKALQELTKKYDPAQTKAITEASKARERAEGIIVQHMQREENLAQKIARVEAGRLFARRDTLAADQKSLDIARISNEIESKRTELIYEQEKSKQRILGFELRLLQQQKAKAAAERANAITEAQRQLQREIGGLMIEQTDLENEIINLRVKSAELIHGEEVSIAASLNTLNEKLQNEAGILIIKRDLEKLGVNEIEILKEIDIKYKGLATALRDRYKNEKLILEQQEAQYKLTRLQVEQERQQSTRQAKAQFDLERQRLTSFQDPTGIGFFGDALITQKLNLAEYNTTLQEYNKQLLDLEQRRQVPGLNPDTALRLADESAKLKDQIAAYREYQPAIIQARLEQDRFNTIFKATGAITDTVIDGFIGVAEGTATAQEAFASFLRSVADMLMSTVKQMIAQYIALGIARQFAGLGLPAASSTGGFAGMTVANNPLGEAMTFNLMGFADGGKPPVGRPSIVGERGPELFIPRSSGTIVPNEMLGGMGGDVSVVVNVDASGSSVQGDDTQAKALGTVVSVAVRAEIVKQQRPGGLLAGTR